MLVWIRMGDLGGYYGFDSPEEAGNHVGCRLDEWDDTFRYRISGVMLPPKFVGDNYVSLFWGDEDARYERGLSLAEQDRFERGVLLGYVSGHRE